MGLPLFPDAGWGIKQQTNNNRRKGIDTKKEKPGFRVKSPFQWT